MQFGEYIDETGRSVLNEREIRASAGILFMATFTSWVLLAFKNNPLPIKYVVTIILVDFIIRVFAHPRFSPTLIIGRIIVSSQTPEYVSAAPKKFAWTIGLVLSAVMFVSIIAFNSFSTLTATLCILCLVFLFFESAFGICLGCMFYPIFFKRKSQLCAGEICSSKSRHPIQKISPLQLFIVCFFTLIVAAVAWLGI